MSLVQHEVVLANRFRVRAQIGYASLGWLYHAFDPERAHDVALRLAVTARDVASTHERLAAHIGRLASVPHPGLAKVYDCGLTEGQLWFTSEWLSGISLERHIGNTGPLQPLAVVRIGIELATALAEAHRHGLLHRGLKPRNIFLREAGAIALDLGVGATIWDDGGVISSTPSAMPREQILNSVVDHRADIFGLGACLFGAVVGRPPFDGRAGEKIAAQGGWRAPRAREMNASVPEGIELVLLRAMATRPEDRFQSMSELATALSQVRI